MGRRGLGTVSDQQSRLPEKLHSILKICLEMNSTRDLSALLDLIAREAARLMEADRASIFLLDREKGELWSKVALGSEEILRFDARLGIAGAAALTGQLINVQDAYQDPRFHKAMDIHTGYRTQSVLAMPLQNLAGETIGTFELLNKKGGLFTEENENVVKSFAAQVAISIERTQCPHGSGAKATPRKIAEREHAVVEGGRREVLHTEYHRVE